MSTTPPENIAIFKIDNNAFTGSADTLKKIVGGTYSVVNNPTDYIGTDVVKDDPVNTGLIGMFNGVDAYEITNIPHKIKYIQANNTLVENSNTGPVKRLKFPVRIIGDDSQILNNEEWQRIVVGGNYANQTYEPLYTEGSFDILGHKYDTYYPEIKKTTLKSIKENLDINSYDMNYEYNAYLPTYQKAIESLHERLSTNVYFNQLYNISADSTDTTFSLNTRKELENFVTREGAAANVAKDLHIAKDQQLTETPPPYVLITGQHSDDRSVSDGKYKDRSLLLRQYLTGAFVNNELSASTIEYISNKSKTTYFTLGALSSIFSVLQQEDGTTDPKINRYPMYGRIKFPLHQPSSDTNSYANIITNNNIQEEVLSYLKNTFIGPGSVGGTAAPIQYVQHKSELNVDASSTGVVLVKETATLSNPAVDFLQMMIDIGDNPETIESQDELYLSSDLVETAGMKNSLSSFRYTKSINSAKALKDSIDKINSAVSDPSSLFYIDETEYPHTNFVDLHQAIADSIETNEPEVIAYRISKIGGPPVGDSRRSDLIQNTFLFNSAPSGNPALSQDGTDLIYYDTQVKYNETYTYEIYAYMLVEGIKYRYSNLNLGRYTGNSNYLNVSGSYVTDTQEPHCIEFYDSTYTNITEQLLNTETNLTGKFVPYTYEQITGAGYEAVALCYIHWLDSQKESFGYAPSVEYSSNLAKLNNAFGDTLDKLYPELAASTISEKHAVAYKDFAMRYKIYSPDIDTHSGGSMTLGPYALGELGASTYATNAQIKSSNKFMADFFFEMEPTVKIIQVPLAVKSVTILDHPPMACDVTPYQRKDNSQIIGFYITQESYAYNPDKDYQTENTNYGLYPTPISAEEEQIKQTYMLSNNLTENKIIKKESVSPVTSVNVYRLSEKPNSLSDFDNNLIFTKSLSYKEDYNYNYNNCFYEEAVATNKKYYYLFKFVNANGVSGYVSPIQVVELVDDGGYKYALFDVMYETDLGNKQARQISTSFKKLFQVIPAPRHTEFVTTDVDFSKNPFVSINNNEVVVGSAEELIWGKKFKFRITSKKTGKKIDINIKYNLGNT